MKLITARFCNENDYNQIAELIDKKSVISYQPATPEQKANIKDLIFRRIQLDVFDEKIIGGFDGDGKLLGFFNIKLASFSPFWTITNGFIDSEHDSLSLSFYHRFKEIMLFATNYTENLKYFEAYMLCSVLLYKKLERILSKEETRYSFEIERFYKKDTPIEFRLHKLMIGLDIAPHDFVIQKISLKQEYRKSLIFS